MKPYYQDRLTTLYCANNRDEFFYSLPKIDLLCTDPPYGISVMTQEEQAHRMRRGAKLYKQQDWDDKPADKEQLNRWIRAARVSVIWGGNYFELSPSSGWLVWDKGRRNDFSDAELAWTSLKKGVKVFNYVWDGCRQQEMKNKEYRFHPTQKPVALTLWTVKAALAQENIQSIIDPWAGSGSILIAARKMGIPAIGIERDEFYCQKIREWILLGDNFHRANFLGNKGRRVVK